jgi:hypothetical protein
MLPPDVNIYTFYNFIARFLLTRINMLSYKVIKLYYGGKDGDLEKPHARNVCNRDNVVDRYYAGGLIFNV